MNKIFCKILLYSYDVIKIKIDNLKIVFFKFNHHLRKVLNTAKR
jgi:hypothetical protein